MRRWEASVSTNQDDGPFISLPVVSEEGGGQLLSQPIRVSFMFSVAKTNLSSPIIITNKKRKWSGSRSNI